VDAGRSFEHEEPGAAARLFEQASGATFNQADSARLLFNSAVLYEKAGVFDAAEGAFKKYLAASDLVEEKRAEALFRLGNLQIHAGRGAEGKKTLSALSEGLERRRSLFAARARLILLSDDLDAFMRVALRQPFEKTFDKKTDLMDALLKDYSVIAEANYPELLPEIFYYMGQTFENFRDSILQSERPSGLDDDELVEYNFLLEEKAYTFDEQAAEAYENSLLAGRQWRVFNEQFQKSIEKLASLKPALYKRDFVDAPAEPEHVRPVPMPVVTVEWEGS
jgi:hypothetical protein